MEIARVDEKYDYHLCGERLTTGPDLPVRPIGPAGPLIASCRQTQQTHFTLYKLHSNMHCLSFLHNILYVELGVYLFHTCFLYHPPSSSVYALFVVCYSNNSKF